MAATVPQGEVCWPANKRETRRTEADDRDATLLNIPPADERNPDDISATGKMMVRRKRGLRPVKRNQ